MPIIAQCNSTEYKQNHLAKQTQAQKPSAVGLSKQHPVSSLSGHSISVSLQQRAKCIVGYGNCLLCPVAYWAPSSCYFFFFFFCYICGDVSHHMRPQTHSTGWVSHMMSAMLSLTLQTCIQYVSNSSAAQTTSLQHYDNLLEASRTTPREVKWPIPIPHVHNGNEMACYLYDVWKVSYNFFIQVPQPKIVDT